MPRNENNKNKEQEYAMGAKRTHSFVTARTWSTALCILDSQVKQSRG